MSVREIFSNLSPMKEAIRIRFRWKTAYKVYDHTTFPDKNIESFLATINKKIAHFRHLTNLYANMQIAEKLEKDVIRGLFKEFCESEYGNFMKPEQRAKAGLKFANYLYTASSCYKEEAQIATKLLRKPSYIWRDLPFSDLARMCFVFSNMPKKEMQMHAVEFIASEIYNKKYDNIGENPSFLIDDMGKEKSSREGTYNIDYIYRCLEGTPEDHIARFETQVLSSRFLFLLDSVDHYDYKENRHLNEIVSAPQFEFSVPTEKDGLRSVGDVFKRAILNAQRKKFTEYYNKIFNGNFDRFIECFDTIYEQISEQKKRAINYADSIKKQINPNNYQEYIDGALVYFQQPPLYKNILYRLKEENEKIGKGMSDVLREFHREREKFLDKLVDLKILGATDRSTLRRFIDAQAYTRYASELL